MKTFLLPLALSALVVPALRAADAPAPLPSGVHALRELAVEPTPVGTRRLVFDGPTTTVDKLHCHVTTLNAGASSGEPRRHLQEEILIVQDGEVEAHWDGQSRVAHAGDVIHFAAGATTHLRNASAQPATYYVIYFYTPATPTK